MYRLRELREEKRMTQIRLAVELNTNQQQISKIENGQSEPTAGLLMKAADFFGVSVDYLLGRTDCRNYESLPQKQQISESKIINYYKTLDERDKKAVSLLVEYYKRI